VADRVFLHIGAAKTGTSYLQLLLWNNRDALREQGIYLPLRKRRHHFDAVADLRGGMWSDKPISRTWDELAARVHKLTGTAVVSEELLCASPPDRIERIMSTLAPAEVHVILTARDIGRQVPAEWQQLVRARGQSTYEHYVGTLRHSETSPFWNIQDPVGVHGRWGPYLAEGCFHLVTVPPRGNPASLLWERFASVIGADPSTAAAPSMNQNESLGLVETELLRRFNAQLGEEFPLRTPYVEVVRRWLTRPALMGADNERIGVPAEHTEWLRERSEQMVAQVEALSGRIDVVGDAKDLLAADITLADRAPDELTDSELLERALAAWTRQLAHLKAEDDERIAARDEWRQEMAQLRAELDAARAAHPAPVRRLRSLGGRARRRLRGGPRP
jgi:hypothetical protein